MHGDGLDAHLFAGPDNATGNLAAICDQDLLEFARIKSHKKLPQKSTESTKSFCAFCACLRLNS
jgi:hypothetical protein